MVIDMEEITYIGCDLPDKPPVPFVYGLGFGDKFTQTDTLHYDNEEDKDNEQLFFSRWTDLAGMGSWTL